MAAAVLGAVALAFLSLAAGGAGTGQYLVLAAPSSNGAGVLGVIHRAGGSLVALGRLPGVAVAWSEDPGFPAAARAQGAWLAIPTSGFAGCTAATPEPAP